jgi:NAD(P)-dependent dehydrogenase (short-subunit alcohol dehydrogenase family)
VIHSDRDPPACDRTVRALQEAGHQATGLAADLAQTTSVDSLCAAAGTVDVLVCNGGIQGPVDPLQRSLMKIGSRCLMSTCAAQFSCVRG